MEEVFYVVNSVNALADGIGAEHRLLRRQLQMQGYGLCHL
jgi:hypothetical protein